MTYKYHYTGELGVELPTHRINTEGKDKDFIYETTEPINHPDFVLIEEQSETEQPQEQETTPIENTPQQEEVHQTENVSQEENTPIE